MEPDFVTRQHLESLSNGDSGFAEVLNRYRLGSAPSPPPPPPPQYFGNPYHAPPPVLNGNGDAVLLSNMLGQIQAGIQHTQNNSPSKFSNYDGFQLNINSDILKWVGLLLLVLVLVWLFLKVNKKKKTSIGKKIDNLQDEIRTLKGTGSSRYNPKPMVKSAILDSEDDFDSEDLDFEDLDDLEFSEEL